jgi:hypothetical protein
MAMQKSSEVLHLDSNDPDTKDRGSTDGENLVQLIKHDTGSMFSAPA